jgi:hypothetical protein
VIESLLASDSAGFIETIDFVIHGPIIDYNFNPSSAETGYVIQNLHLYANRCMLTPDYFDFDKLDAA